MGQGETFIDEFKHGWSLPKPEGFLEYFAPRIHAGAVQRAKPTPNVIGPAGQAAFFRRFFRLIPDAAVEVVSSAVDGEWVFIRTRITGHLGGRRAVTFDGVDHFRLVDGKIAERDTFTDATPLFGTLARSPRSWWAGLRFLVGR